MDETPPSPTLETEIRRIDDTDEEQERNEQAWDVMECAICHDTAASDPVAMECKAQHVYCFGCVFQYFKSMRGNPVSCPQCRQGNGTFVIMSRLKKVMDLCCPVNSQGDRRLSSEEFQDVPTSLEYFNSIEYLSEMFPQRFRESGGVSIVNPMQMRYFVQNFDSLKRLLSGETTIEDPNIAWRSYNGNLLPFNLAVHASNSRRARETERWNVLAQQLGYRHPPRITSAIDGSPVVAFGITEDEVEGEGFRIDFSPRPSPSNDEDDDDEEEGEERQENDENRDPRANENTGNSFVDMVGQFANRMQFINSRLNRLNSLASQAASQARVDRSEEEEIDRLMEEALREIPRELRRSLDASSPQPPPLRTHRPVFGLRSAGRPMAAPMARQLQDFNASETMRNWVANRYNICHVAVTFPFVTVGRRRPPHFRVSLSRSSAISHLVSNASTLYFGVVIAMALSRTPPSRDDFSRYIPISYFSRTGPNEVRRVDESVDLLSFLRAYDEDINGDSLMVTIWSILAEVEEAFRQGVLSHMVSREYGLVETSPIEAST